MNAIKGLLIGLVGFLGISAVSSFVFPPGLLPIVFTAVVGSLLLLVVMGYRHELLKNTVLSILALVVAFLVGFGIGNVASLIPMDGVGANVVFFIFAATIYAVLMGLILHGKKSLGFFIGVGLVTSIILTAIIFFADLLQGVFYKGVDLNLLIILATLGATAGFTLGVYQDRHKEIHT